MPSRHKKDCRTAGFSLIEICIVLAIVGMFMGTAAQAYNTYLIQRKATQTMSNIEVVKAAIAAYQATNGYYPCPAPIDVQPDTINYAVASDCTIAAVAPGVVAAPGRDHDSANLPIPALEVRIGGVPGRTMGLPDNVLVDGWGYRLQYAVTTGLAIDQPTFNAANGAIYVTDIGNHQIPPATVPPTYDGTNHYTIVSHGIDGKGSFTNAGILHLPCPAPALPTTPRDQPNCNGGATFVYSTQLAMANTTFPNHHYDDFMDFSKTATVAAAAPSGSGPGGHINFTSNGTWVVPAGVTKISVMVIGGGGGGYQTVAQPQVAGGGGGGSCIKNGGGTVMASANGGNGGGLWAGWGAPATAGSRSYASITVTPADTLSIYLGGGGGGGGSSAVPFGSYGMYAGGGGGYGACGTSGGGGGSLSTGGGPSGVGGANIGGGGGAGYDIVGSTATTSTGGSGGMENVNSGPSGVGGTGGSATAGGTSNTVVGGGGGGGSGGMGGLGGNTSASGYIASYATPGGLATKFRLLSNYPVVSNTYFYPVCSGQIATEPGEAGTSIFCGGIAAGSIGGGPGSVEISW